MTQSSKKSPTDEPPLEIWLSGNEIINLVTDLLEPRSTELRATGRSKKLALAYATAALKLPNQKIRIKDHFNANGAHFYVQSMVCKILDALGIEYEVGQIPGYIRDPNEFTGVRKVDDNFYVVARPTPPKSI